MTSKQIQEALEEVLSSQDFARRKQLLDSLVTEDPENVDVQAAQYILGDMYFQGKKGVRRDPVRARQMLMNPAKHGHSQALLDLAAIAYQAGKPEAIGLFAQAWATGGNGAEAAAAKLEELRRAGEDEPAFMQLINSAVQPQLTALEKKIREGRSTNGSAQLALALYYIYELDGPDGENLQTAYDYLREALAQENPLASIYLKRTAFAHMENPKASARLIDAKTDYTPQPEPEDDDYDDGQDEGASYEPEEEKKGSLFSAFNMPYTIHGPYNRVYTRLTVGAYSADYICDDGDMVTIRDEDISLGALSGYSATIPEGYFWW